MPSLDLMVEQADLEDINKCGGCMSVARGRGQTDGQSPGIGASWHAPMAFRSKRLSMSMKDMKMLLR